MPQRRPQRLDERGQFDLVGAIYEAATDSSAWTDVLARLAEATRSRMAGLMLHDTGTAEGSLEIHWGIDPADLDRYNHHYAAINPVVHRAHQRGWTRPGFVRLSHEILLDDELRSTEYFSDFLQPADLVFGLGCTLIEEGSQISTLTLQRSARTGPYGETERRALAGLAPHLRRALEIHERLARERAFSQAVSSSLDALAIGAFLLAADGRVLERNRSAQSLADAGDGLKVESGRLRAASSEATRALGRLVAGCAAVSRREGVPPAAPLFLPRPSGLRPFEVLATPLAATTPWRTAGSAALVLFVLDLERRTLPRDQRLRELFGLTPAQARFAAELSRGGTLRETAAALGIRLETARSHLKEVFAKTATKRQGELLALLGRAAIRIGEEGD